jgi:cathepsin H
MASVGVVGGSVNITVGDEVELLHAVFEHGPVSIAYQVVDGFKDYKSGVYHSTVCNNTAADVNHAVLAVGFGHEEGMDYWIVKNSWGTSWGDNGYFKIQRGVNMCGCSNCNSFPQDVADLTQKVASTQAFTEIVQ